MIEFSEMVQPAPNELTPKSQYTSQPYSVSYWESKFSRINENQSEVIDENTILKHLRQKKKDPIMSEKKKIRLSMIILLTKIYGLDYLLVSDFTLLQRSKSFSLITKIVRKLASEEQN